MAEPVMKKIHLPLPPDLHAELKREAEETGTPTTVLAREAITEWLERRRREQVAEELRAFARENAGTELDLDQEFEEAAADTLAESPR